ncbi:MAG: metallophosphoesterase family protein [Bacillota bacterium]|jgi:putative phosphoesterase
MRIGVISDTHIPRHAKQIPAQVKEMFRGVDLILHAGDINTQSVLRELNAIAPTEAVAGNTDSAAAVQILGERKLLELGGFRVGLTHGHLGRGNTTPERALSCFPQADVVVFGHSHQPFNQLVKGKLLLNPGSPTAKRQEKHYSVAILTLGDEATAEILHF